MFRFIILISSCIAQSSLKVKIYKTPLFALSLALLPGSDLFLEVTLINWIDGALAGTTQLSTDGINPTGNSMDFAADANASYMISLGTTSGAADQGRLTLDLRAFDTFFDLNTRDAGSAWTPDSGNDWQTEDSQTWTPAATSTSYLLNIAPPARLLSLQTIDGRLTVSSGGAKR